MAEQFDRARWEDEIRGDLWRWRHVEQCPSCGEWIGHFGGSTERDPCPKIPADVPLEEVRPNCYTVLRHWIGDAIRAVVDREETKRRPVTTRERVTRAQRWRAAHG